MAPEQLEGRDADARTDIFAFGAVLYEMVTGKRAFEGKSQALLMSRDLRRRAAAAVDASSPRRRRRSSTSSQTCLAKDPDDRWQTARDLLAELRLDSADVGAAATAIMPGRRSRADPSGCGSGWRRRGTIAAGVLASPRREARRGRTEIRQRWSSSVTGLTTRPAPFRDGCLRFRRTASTSCIAHATW